MKAALLSECPSAQLVDVSHSVPPFAIEAGAFVLWAGTRHFGPGSVHLAVVDPGVGGARRRLAVRAGGKLYVAPDNGLLDIVLGDADGFDAYELAPAEQAAPTFEGRDVFAPAAGQLAAGADPGELGERLDGSVLVRLPARAPHVVWVDAFGNLVLSVRPPARPLRIGGIEVAAVGRTFSEAPAGVPFCYVGSMGRLEVGVREGRADVALGATPGTAVEELGPA
jgi:S-adenosylmethionine hydrolase